MRRYLVYKCEMLTVVKAFMHYKEFICRQFTVETDCTALFSIFTFSLSDSRKINRFCDFIKNNFLLLP